MNTPLLDLSITPRDVCAQRDLIAAQADILTRLEQIAEVRWRYNDFGARAVIVTLPAGMAELARNILAAHYMVDVNPSLRHL
ncbi:MAG TPA: hypothetical protein VF800_05555 [Telluria sp.]